MPTINVSDFLGGSFIGFNGSRGFTGSRAYTGSRGFTGSQGYQGSQGYVGSRAYTGSRGFRGSIGYTGSQSYTGSRGFRGSKGYAGSQGYTGSRGFRGSKGYTGSKGGFADWIYLTPDNNNFVAADLQALIANTITGSFTIKLPPTPVMGDVIAIVDGGNWALNNLTIDPNGNTIEGFASNYLATIQGIRLEFFYDGTTWQIVNSRGPTGFSGSRGIRGYSGSLGFTGSRGMKAQVSEITPTGADVVSGHMWFDPTDATLSVYYNDGDTNQWVVTSGPAGSPGDKGFTGSRGFIGYTGYVGSRGFTGVNGILVGTSVTAPNTPANGQLWFDPVDASLSVYYNDGNSDQWVVTSGPAGTKGENGKIVTDVITFTSNMTPASGDQSKMFMGNSINTLTFTIPNSSTNNFTLGTTFLVTQLNIGQITFSGEAGVTLYRRSGTASATLSQYSVVMITKIADNIWLLHGDLA